MSQSSITDGAVPYALGGVPRFLNAARAWPLHVLDRLRQAVLPDADTPVASFVAGPVMIPSSRSRWWRLFALLPKCILGIVAAVLVVAIGLLVFRVQYEGRIYPAVAVGDVNVGGLTVSQAEDRLAQRAAELEQGQFTFTHGDQTWTPTLQELGVAVDLDASIAEAQDLGRTGDAATRLAFTSALLDSDQHVPIRMKLDQAKLDAWFDTVDQDIGQLAIDARLTIDGDGVAISEASSGLAVDRPAATAQVLAALSSLQPVAVDLPVRVDEPEFTHANLVPVQAMVERMIAEPIEVSFESESWSIEGTMLAPYLLIDTAMDQGAPTAQLAIDSNGLASELRTRFGDQVNRQPVDAVVGWDDGVTVLEPSSAGVTIKGGAFAEAVAGSFLNGHHPVEIPVVHTRPKIDGDNVAALGITTLLGQGSSNFSDGVEGRDANVELATEYMNGTLVPPGGIFSFNDAIGEITYERGFQEALVVQGEGVGRDVGGGVCQVSTTIFRAALNAGMPITEWYAHTYRLPNYELDGWGPGFDASILQWGPNPAEWPDFEFENYTGSWLLIESTVSYPYVHVNIYGTGDGREVIIDAWEIGNNAFGFNRVIQDPQGNVIAERTFESHFK
ncbi:MAG: VanW family protein [Chloroflexota bacterium]|nr:VanW family protein [Chloroflexota bacterium]